MKNEWNFFVFITAEWLYGFYKAYGVLAIFLFMVATVHCKFNLIIHCNFCSFYVSIIYWYWFNIHWSTCFYLTVFSFVCFSHFCLFLIGMFLLVNIKKFFFSSFRLYEPRFWLAIYLLPKILWQISIIV